MESLASTGRAAAARAPRFTHSVQIDYQVTPFRGQKFVDQYLPAIKRPLSFGATGYLFYRSDEDSDRFVHMIFWEDRAGFDRWWYSQEMQDIRAATAGLHGQPVLPKWNTVLDRG